MYANNSDAFLFVLLWNLHRSVTSKQNKTKAKIKAVPALFDEVIVGIRIIFLVQIHFLFLHVPVCFSAGNSEESNLHFFLGVF